MTRTETTDAPLRIADDDGTVVVEKVFTRTGERLEIAAPRLDRSIRLDAIAIESLTWQDPEAMAERAASVPDGLNEAAAADAASGPEREDAITVSNEFAMARVEKEQGDDGDYLAATAPKLGYDARLGVRELEWVASQDHETFTEFLEQPFGPGSDEDHH
jgi:hypothetical protein